MNAGYQKMLQNAKYTSEGVSFLKCAFAPPARRKWFVGWLPWGLPPWSRLWAGRA